MGFLEKGQGGGCNVVYDTREKCFPFNFFISLRRRSIFRWRVCWYSLFFSLSDEVLRSFFTLDTAVRKNDILHEMGFFLPRSIHRDILVQLNCNDYASLDDIILSHFLKQTTPKQTQSWTPSSTQTLYPPFPHNRPSLLDHSPGTTAPVQYIASLPPIKQERRPCPAAPPSSL